MNIDLKLNEGKFSKLKRGYRQADKPRMTKTKKRRELNNRVKYERVSHFVLSLCSNAHIQYRTINRTYA